MGNQVFNKKDWEKVKFGDISKEVRTSEKEPLKNGIERYVGLEHIESEDLHIRSWGDVADGTTFTRKFTEGQLLFGRRRAYLRKAAIADFDGVCSGDILVFEANTERVLPEFFPYIIQNDKFFNFAVDESAGSLSPRVKYKDLAEYEFFLPPLAEQKKLADLLWAGDEVLQRYRELERELGIYRQSYFKNKVISKKKNGVLSDLYEIRKERSDKPHEMDKYLGMEGVDSGKIFLSKLVDSKDIRSSSSIFYEGDVLYGKLRPNLDKAIIADTKGICSTEFLVLKPHKEKKWFLCQYLHSKQFVEYVSARGFGTKMPRVSAQIISKFRIHIPDANQIDLINNEISNLYILGMGYRKHIKRQLKLNKSLINQIFG